jgi:hypothetical protein
MKISDLAAIVSVRNHILTVMNDKTIVNRDEYSVLNQTRIKLDKKFVELVKKVDIENLLPSELLLVKVGDANYKPTPADLDAWRSVFEEAQSDPDFKIFTHDAVSLTKFEIAPGTGVRVVPAIETRTLEVSPNVKVTKTIPKQLDLPFTGGQSTKKSVTEAVTELGNGNLETLKNALVKLEEQSVRLTPAVVEDAVKPIMAPEEQKKSLVEDVKKSEPAKEDTDLLSAIQRQKEELKKQGRVNKKVKKDE